MALKTDPLAGMLLISMQATDMGREASGEVEGQGAYGHPQEAPPKPPMVEAENPSPS